MLKVLFIGRRNLFYELSRVIAGPVEYIDSCSITTSNEELCLMDYYIDIKCSGNCIKLSRDIDTVGLLAGLLNAIISTLNRSTLRIGIDYGVERVGLVLVNDNEPLVGTVISPVELNALIGLIRHRVDDVIIGNSPLANVFIKTMLHELCGIANNVAIVDEASAAELRRWLRNNKLSDDAADAYAMVLTEPSLVIRCLDY